MHEVISVKINIVSWVRAENFQNGPNSNICYCKNIWERNFFPRKIENMKKRASNVRLLPCINRLHSQKLSLFNCEPCLIIHQLKRLWFIRISLISQGVFRFVSEPKIMIMPHFSPYIILISFLESGSCLGRGK